MVAKAHMHLAQFLTHGPSYHSLGMWRHPKTASAGFDWRQPDLYQRNKRSPIRLFPSSPRTNIVPNNGPSVANLLIN